MKLNIQLKHALFLALGGMLSVWILSAGISAATAADASCESDFYASQPCADNKTTWRSSTDAFGHETWRDDNGAKIHARTDFFGHKTYRNNQNNNTWRARTDILGNQTYRDDHGHTIRARTDFFGHKIYRDDNGNTVKCSTDFFDNQTCR